MRPLGFPAALRGWEKMHDQPRLRVEPRHRITPTRREDHVMAFVKREVQDNLITLGDGENDIKRTGGILVRTILNTMFDKPKTDYEFVDKHGDLKVLGGSASIARQISETDMGKFFKAEFEGWGKSAKGKFKQIAVYIWDGEPDDTMKAWPGFEKYYGKNGNAKAPTAESFTNKPKALEDDEDSDLPF